MDAGKILVMLQREGWRVGKKNGPKVCPECDHEFQGNGWDGIDANWRAKHNHIMPYDKMRGRVDLKLAGINTLKPR